LRSFKQFDGGLWMKRCSALAVTLLACAGAAYAQFGRTIDWYTFAGDSQRTGWEKSDSKFTKDSVKDFKLVLKRKLEGTHKGKETLMPPVILGNLISHRGFKELAFVTGSAGDVWVVDSDLDKMFWQTHIDLPSGKSKSANCPAGITAEPTLTPGVMFGSFGRRRTPGKSVANAAPEPSRDAMMKRVFGPRPLYLLAADGKLHRLDTSTGKDVKPPFDFLPAHADASNLNFADDTVYTTTSNGCGGAPNAVWAADVTDTDHPKVASFVSDGAGFVGEGGAAADTNGTIYVQTGDGTLDAASNKWANSVLALTPKELKLKDYFTAPEGGSATPIVFTNKDRELVVVAGNDGRVYLLDSQSLGGSDHQTPLASSVPVSSEKKAILGLSTWEDTSGIRFIAATIAGPVSGDIKSSQTNGDAPNGSIVALKLNDDGGKLTLVPAWASPDISMPQGPVIANGVVFVLSAGEARSKAKQLKGHATLFGLDAGTGKEIYSTGDQVNAPANPTGITIANGRVYFTTADSDLYAFGYSLEH
jgi:hypothetical protein